MLTLSFAAVLDDIKNRHGITSEVYPPTEFDSRYCVTFRKDGLEANHVYATNKQTLYNSCRAFLNGLEFGMALERDYLNQRK